MAPLCKEMGFGCSSDTQQARITGTGIQPKADEPLVSHKNPAQSPSHPLVQGPVTLCCLLFSVLGSLKTAALSGVIQQNRRQGDTCPLASPTAGSQQGWLLLHRQALHTSRTAQQNPHLEMRKDGRAHNSTRKGWRTHPT